MIDFLARIAVAAMAVILVVVVVCLLGLGTLLIFGSFFFEETASQMTWVVVAKHLGIFGIGVLMSAVGAAIASIGMQKLYQ